MRSLVYSIFALAVFGTSIGLAVLVSGSEERGTELTKSAAQNLLGGQSIHDECAYDWDCEPYDKCENSICPDCEQHVDEYSPSGGYACAEAEETYCRREDFDECLWRYKCKSNASCQCVIDYVIPVEIINSWTECNTVP
jgi:hypothetical protein